MANLHVFTGDEAANNVRAALGIPEREFLVQHDVISCGPLRSYEDRGEWLDERYRFWNDVFGGGGIIDPLPNDLVEEAPRLASADRVIAWVGAGLSDRLLVPSLVHLFSIDGVTPPPIEVAEIVSHQSLKVPVLGWGMLRPKDIGKPARRQLTESELAAARATWNAVTSRDPLALVRHLQSLDDTSELNGLATLIERYPDERHGLSHWDASLLRVMPARRSTAFEVVGGAIGANHHHLDPVGDMYLFWRLRRMAEAHDPLVVLEGDRRIFSDNLRTTHVRPTELGLKVRDGETSAVARSGIDDWVGGVHLRSATGSPWYRRNGELLPQNAT